MNDPTATETDASKAISNRLVHGDKANRDVDRIATDMP
jgi:hypothetical protein